MKTLLIVVLTIVLYSCGMKDSSTINVIDLLSTPESEIKNHSEIATDVEYIPFQTSQNSLIRYIVDFKTNDNKLYIYGY